MELEPIKDREKGIETENDTSPINGSLSINNISETEETE